MCDKAVDNCAHALELVPDCSKIQKMFNKAINTYFFYNKFVSGCYNTQEMCDKEVNTCFIVFYSVFSCYKTQEMCDSVAFEDSLMLIYCPDKYVMELLIFVW